MKKKILNFQVDTTSEPKSFVSRMAKEYKWSIKFAEQSFAEYKKFIYLIFKYKKSLTPSQTIDKVWHFHLLYTKSYWHDFCKGTLKREIHHNPETGAKGEGEVFIQNYQDTIKLYKLEFGNPPNRIWKIKKIKYNATKMLVITAVATLFLNSCTTDDNVFPILFFIIFFIAIITLVVKGKVTKCSSDHSCNSDCSSSCGSDCSSI
jgi:hypothetical protein